MSTAKKKPPKAKPQITPLIGSLLRLPHEAVIARMFEDLNSKGFDVTLTELGVFLYPGPEGRRPVDLARQCNMTRQAMNYVLTNLEKRGYIERQTGAGIADRAVHLTDRGWEVIVLIRRIITEIEQEWTRHLGTLRFKALSETLHELSQWLGKLP